jgi:hypothetical protein
MIRRSPGAGHTVAGLSPSPVRAASESIEAAEAAAWAASSRSGIIGARGAFAVEMLPFGNILLPDGQNPDNVTEREY